MQSNLSETVQDQHLDGAQQWAAASRAAPTPHGNSTLYTGQVTPGGTCSGFYAHEETLSRCFLIRWYSLRNTIRRGAGGHIKNPIKRAFPGLRIQLSPQQLNVRSRTITQFLLTLGTRTRRRSPL